MIAKVSGRGSKAAGLVYYLAGPGRAEEHTGQRVIAASDGLAVPVGEQLEKADLYRLAAELDAPAKMHGCPRRGHVYHVSLSNRADDRELSDDEWADVARDMVRELGLDGDDTTAGCRWVVFRHGHSAGGHDHVHLAVDLVREDGTVARLSNDYRTLSAACSRHEQRLGLNQVEGRSGRGRPGISQGEAHKAERLHRPEPARVTLARQVRAAAVASSDETDFVARCRANGLVVRPRWAKGGETHAVGYSVAEKPPDGQQPVWYGGGSLDKELTLPKLRARWEPAQPRSAAAAWAGRGRGADVGPKSIAASQWGEATERLRAARAELAGADPGDPQWALAARETAGTTAALSNRLEPGRPGPLATATAALGDAGRQSPGTARASRQGAMADLRGVAVVAAQAALGDRGSVVAAAMLIAELAVTVRAIRAAQAAGARAQAAAAQNDAAAAGLDALHRRYMAAPDQLLAELHPAAVAAVKQPTRREPPRPPAAEPGRAARRRRGRGKDHGFER